MFTVLHVYYFIYYLLAPKGLLDYLRPMITIPSHPIQPNPVHPQSLFNHLNRPWIDLSRPPMTIRWPSNDYQMTIRWLSDDYPMTIWWLSDDYPMTIQWLSKWLSRTFDLFFLMTIDLKRSINRRFKSGAKFILGWSCFCALSSKVRTLSQYVFRTWLFYIGYLCIAPLTKLWNYDQSFA